MREIKMTKTKQNELKNQETRNKIAHKHAERKRDEIVLDCSPLNEIVRLFFQHSKKIELTIQMDEN